MLYALLFPLLTYSSADITVVVTDPSGVRISVNGDILSLKEPRSTWARHFGDILPVSSLQNASSPQRAKAAIRKPSLRLSAWVSTL